MAVCNVNKQLSTEFESKNDLFNFTLDNQNRDYEIS